MYEELWCWVLQNVTLSFQSEANHRVPFHLIMQKILYFYFGAPRKFTRCLKINKEIFCKRKKSFGSPLVGASSREPKPCPFAADTKKIERRTHRHTYRMTERQADKQTSKQTDKQTNRQTERSWKNKKLSTRSYWPGFRVFISLREGAGSKFDYKVCIKFKWSQYDNLTALFRVGPLKQFIYIAMLILGKWKWNKE